MTRDELIEAVAVGSWISIERATAALSAIETAGFAIVPVVASDGMVKAGAVVCEGWVYVDEAVAIYSAMIAAAQEELK